jgi:translocator protein
MKINKPAKLIISLFAPLLAGGIGTIFTSPSIPTWYAALNKPALNPPGWVFGPVWTVLYIMMGIAFYLIWTSKSKSKKTSVILYVTQLGLNTLWSIIFFGLHWPMGAFIVIILLLGTIIATKISFLKISKTAGSLLIPYLLWVSFASYLNLMLWMLN